MTYEDVEIEDIILTRQEMDLSQAMIDALYILGKKLGKKWLKTLLDDKRSDEEITKLGGLHEATVPALRRRLKARMARFTFMAETIAQDKSGIADVADLIKRGNNVVLEFGRFGDDLSAYIIVQHYLPTHPRHVHLRRGSREESQIEIHPETPHDFH